MAELQPDGSVKLKDGRIIWADTPLTLVDFMELNCDPIFNCGVGIPSRGSSGGGFIASGGGGGSGARGFQGPSGDTGGSQGPQGWEGFQGPIGEQGEQGVQGVQGRQGPQGFQGVGTQGFQGPQGFQGWQGVQGAFGGPQGAQGPQGRQGWQGVLGTQGALGPSQVILYADQFDNPVNSNWIINGLAAAAADTMNPALSVRRFVFNAETGVGYSVPISLGTTTYTLTFISRAESAPPDVRTAGLKLYYRQIPDNIAVSPTWSGATDGSIVLTDIDIPANDNFQYDSQSIPYATFVPALVPGRTYQFELTRIDPSGGVELAADWDLYELRVIQT